MGVAMLALAGAVRGGARRPARGEPPDAEEPHPLDRRASIAAGGAARASFASRLGLWPRRSTVSAAVARGELA
jgi:hypothetical protein